MRPVERLLRNPGADVWLPIFGATALTGLAACAGPAPDRNPDLGGEATTASSSLPADARYLTHLLFAGTDGTSFYAEFDQLAQGGWLELRYQAWWSRGVAWHPLLQRRDTLPLPRAGWRVLPVGGMSIRIGDAGQVVTLAFAPDADSGARGEPQSHSRVRLEAGEEVAVWTGPTGQRESLGVGLLETEGGTVPGVLFFRRAARALRIPPSAGATQAFLLADSLGNGVLIHAGDPAEPAVAHMWLHGVESAWSDIVFQPADSLANPGGWHFEIPGTDLTGDIRPRPTPDAGALTPGSAIECSLVAGDEEFHFAGLVATLVFP